MRLGIAEDGDGETYVGAALLRRLGQDGRCDPPHQTLADDSGESISTVKRALAAFRDCGLVSAGCGDLSATVGGHRRSVMRIY
jgi:hypothetical protein